MCHTQDPTAIRWSWMDPLWGLPLVTLFSFVQQGTEKQLRLAWPYNEC